MEQSNNWKWNIIYQNNDHMVVRLRNSSNTDFVYWLDVMTCYTYNNFIEIFIFFMTKIKKFNKYYIEFCPITFDNMANVYFEFVLIKTDNFALNADIVSFGEELLNTNTDDIVWFENKSKTLSYILLFNFDTLIRVIIR